MPNNKSSKIKWCFLVGLCPDITEFFSKLADQIIEGGDEYFLIVSSKIAEYSKLKYFHKNIEDPLLYHSVVNTNLLKFEEIAEMIGHCVIRRFPEFFTSPFKELGNE